MRALILCLLGVLPLFAVQSAQAQACTVATTPIQFGTYNPFNASATDSTGSVSVTCNTTVSVLVAYTIKLDGGGGGSVSNRRMTSGASQLFYQVYDSAARTTVWGDGTAGSSMRTDGYLLAVLTPVVKTYTAYGRINALQNIGPGSYADAVTVLLTY